MQQCVLFEMCWTNNKQILRSHNLDKATNQLCIAVYELRTCWLDDLPSFFNLNLPTSNPKQPTVQMCKRRAHNHIQTNQVSTNSYSSQSGRINSPTTQEVIRAARSRSFNHNTTAISFLRRDPLMFGQIGVNSIWEVELSYVERSLDIPLQLLWASTD